ncbi:HEME-HALOPEROXIDASE domain-containing protein [Mycena indigotica]|uniref:HEME-HALOPEROXIDASE domain-containing protein n=1 Tax=Mycena indigotica TaxID=2126181 RepID=A0A8H6S432_9AGAR|nr:HEME-HALOPEROXIDASE domain-containing protein [Mycena indigotica]KAF7292057.1 HEME-HALOPEROXIDASE domain-containing protein [Mycena indigotica]
MLPPLPDEIISEILSPALGVDDDVFTQSTSGAAPFARFAESTSACLLVCKSWLRVATPLLYNVVVIRSKAQAKALAVVLTNNAQLGTFIRKLRVEGGYGAPMQTILLRSPNISDLFLCFNIFGTDNTDGLCKGLAHISPRKLILDDDGERKNKHTAKLMDSLIQAIPRWQRLTCLDLAHVYPLFSRRIDYIHDRLAKISRPIIEGERLTKLLVSQFHSAKPCYTHFKTCHLKTVKIKEPIKLLMSETFDARVMEMESFFKTEGVKLQYDSQDISRNVYELEAMPPLNPFFVPMVGTPVTVQETIWSSVLRFAFALEHAQVFRRKPIDFLLVCKVFLRTGLPHLYESISINRRHTACQLAKTLRLNPQYGGYIRNITLANSVYLIRRHTVTRIEYDGAIDVILTKAASLVKLLVTSRGYHSDYRDYNMTPRIGELAVGWSQVVALSSVATRSLRELSVELVADSTPLTGVAVVLAEFGELRSLSLTSAPELAFDHSGVDNMLSTFPKLEDLTIRGAAPSFFTLLSQIVLPSLRRLTLGPNVACDTFLRTHGHRLTFLCIPAVLFPVANGLLDLCSNLAELSVVFSYQDMDNLSATVGYFNSAHPHECLTTINFTLPYNAMLRASGVNAGVDVWNTFFVSFTSSIVPRLTALRDITLSDPVEWPTTEREINRSTWVKIADMLLGAGVQVSDGQGTRWRSRLGAAKNVNGNLKSRKRKNATKGTDDEDDF